MGFGGISKVPLVDARKKAAEARRLLGQGINPLNTKREAKAARKVEKSPTFGELADGYIAAHQTSWQNTKHARQ